LINVFNGVYPEAGILIKCPVNLQGKGLTPPYFNATDRADAEICDFLIPTLHCAFGCDCDRSKEDLVTYYCKWQSDMSVKKSKDY